MTPWRVAQAAALALVVFWWLWLVRSVGALPPGTDAEAYWAMRLADPYQVPLGGADAFLYSPAVALALYPLTLLPFVAFYAALSAASLAALVWMVGPILSVVALIAFPPVSREIGNGNIHLLLAAAIVAAVRYPGWWAVPLLTKVTPAVGILWHAFRLEWGAVATAAGATAVVVVISAMLTPMLWVEWIEILADSEQRVGSAFVLFSGWPLAVRLVLAVALLGVAARLHRPALIPVAAIIALPAVWTNALSMLVACISLSRRAAPA